MSTLSSPTPTIDSGDDALQERRYLTFRLGAEAYGIGVLAVQEIVRLPAITAVPQLPPHLLGVIDLRGRIVPVVDLRTRFALATDDIPQERRCIVVVRLPTPASNRTALFGLLVDSVEEVVAIPADRIAPPPEFGAAIDVSNIVGLTRIHDAVTTILRLERLVFDSTGSLDCAA